VALRGPGCDAEVVLEESFTWRGDQQVRWSRHGSGPPLVFCHGTPWRSALWHRIADALMPAGIHEFDWTAAESLATPIPAANGLFTARSLAKLYATLAGGGAFNGTRLLSEATLARATAVQTRRIDLVVPFPMHWRLGFHRAATTRGTPPRAFGHYGFGGSGGWADPDRQLAMAMVLNSGIGTPFGDLRTFRISGRVLRCANRRR